MNAVRGVKPNLKFQLRGRSAPPFFMQLLPNSLVRSGQKLWWVPCCLAALILTGCASPENDNDWKFTIEKPLPPSRVVVHEFGVEPIDIPIDAPIGARLGSGVSLTPEQLTIDRKLAAHMTEKL